MQRSGEFERHEVELERKDTLPSIQGILDIEPLYHKFEDEVFIHSENGKMDDLKQRDTRHGRPQTRPRGPSQ